VITPDTAELLTKYTMLFSRFKNIIFSQVGISLIIGIVGGTFGLISPFINNWNMTITLRWLMVIILLFTSIILIVVKLCIDLQSEKENLEIEIKRRRTNTHKVISYKPEQNIFLIERNEDEILGHDAMVSIFYLEENYELEIGKGYVQNIQDRFMQIKLLNLTEAFNSDSITFINISQNNLTTLSKVIVKSYIKYDRNL